MSRPPRVAIVTPYFREPRPLLQRCIESVRRQTVATDHLLVADGHPQSWIDGEPVRHLKLDREHGDYGNTPRGVGALMAIGERYDAIGLLDADNWLEADHVEACLAAADGVEGGAEQCDYVVAQRWLRRPDESILPLPEERTFVDTNCFFFLRGAYCVVPYWALMPREVAPICDRIFDAALRRRRLLSARVPRPTVNYHYLWASGYRRLGETPPPDAKPNIDMRPIRAWLDSQSPRERTIAERLGGLDARADRDLAAGV